MPELVGRLMRRAVAVDRQVGTSWAQTGAALDIAAEAARSRFGRVRAATVHADGGG
ncbi:MULTISPECIES: hypothetical protein [unclassified Streptomyces]|uniref:hypothetical protein n=1 Tax=unclassified Streptomyces TaxID=2593676 RepID=UPI001331AD9C|nr:MULTISPECIES: hypothetical protein [unclassified Streptomyces]